MSQITTITFFRYTEFSAKVWGFKMMQYAHKDLHNVPGQSFYKLMGSGKGDGFNPFPDWSVYSLLQIWENEAAARDFFNNAGIMKKYRSKAHEVWTLYLINIRAVGTWSGKNPFVSATTDPSNPYLAVITRATIKTNRLFDFWRYVPRSQERLKSNKGLIYTKGIGEVPVMQMATFSIWQNSDAMKAYAYGTDGHQGAIKKTRELDWYKEELFSRFQPIRSIGRWYGKNLLPELNGEH